LAAPQPVGEVGTRIRQVRRERGLSQLDLAGDELSASYVSLLESGKRTPTPHVVELLAERLGTSADYLLEGIDVAAREEQNLRLRFAELALHSGGARQALEVFTEIATEAAEGSATASDAVWGRCRALEALGRLEEAVEAYDRVRVEALGEPRRSPRWAESVVALCRVSKEAGDLGRAVELGEEALLYLDGLGLELSDLHVQIVSSLVGVYYARGDLTRAQVLVSELIRTVEAHPSHLARGAAYWNASLVAESRGHLGEAILLAEKALAMYAEGENRRSQSRLTVAYAWLLLRQAEPDIDQSRRLLEQARAELVDTGGQVDVAYCDTELARCELLAGDPDAAIRIAEGVVSSLGEDRLESGSAMLVIGQALCQRGDVDAGRAQVAHASQTLLKVAAGREAAAAWREAGDVLGSLGEHVAAADAYQRALGILGVSAAPTPVRVRTLSES
jgi:transcriptional regulator with XRE-family HTH domain